jgi:hypothetical protein
MLGNDISTKPEEWTWIIMETTTKFIAKFREITYLRSATNYGLKSFTVRINAAFDKYRKNIVIEKVDYKLLEQELKNTLNYEGFSSIEVQFDIWQFHFG